MTDVLTGFCPQCLLGLAWTLAVLSGVAWALLRPFLSRSIGTFSSRPVAPSRAAMVSAEGSDVLPSFVVQRWLARAARRRAVDADDSAASGLLPGLRAVAVPRVVVALRASSVTPFGSDLGYVVTSVR